MKVTTQLGLIAASIVLVGAIATGVGFAAPSANSASGTNHGQANAAIVDPADSPGSSTTWSSAIEVPAVGGPRQNSSFQSVSCTGVGTCTAVGYDANNQPIYFTESDGVWGSATEVANSPGGGALFNSVSCTGVGDCTAVGFDLNDQPIYASESGGNWGTPTEVGDSPGSNFQAVSCTGVGDCTAVGLDGNNNQPIYATEFEGTWGALTPLSAPGGGFFFGVSCKRAGFCTAVGGDGKDFPISATESGGTWGAVDQIVGPLASYFYGVSCTGAGNCTGVGFDGDSGKPMYAIQSAGTWAKATKVTAPGFGQFFSVSCTGPGYCTAVGDDTDALHYPHPVYATESAGRWGGVIRVAGSAGGEGQFVGVSCSEPRDCTAVGGDGRNQPMYAFTLASPSITSPNSTAFTHASFGTFTVRATGRPTPSIAESGQLPVGLTFTDNGNGTATISGTSVTGGVGSHPITFTASNGVSPDATQSFTLKVNPATPVIIWPTPAPISYGTLLGSIQLDATTSAIGGGTFTYTPAVGQALQAGNHTLSVTFAPNHITDYTDATATVALTVYRAIPSIVWPQPGSIEHGTPLSSAQLDATSNVFCTMSYSPGAGAVLPVGTDHLAVMCSPADSVDYSTAKAQTTLVVRP